MSSSIHHRWWHPITGWFIGCILWLWGKTLRISINNKLCEHFTPPSHAIFTIWHKSILLGPFCFRKALKQHKISVLTSASKDGSFLAAVVRFFHIGAIHGSTSRRGARALVELKRTIEQDNNVCITPDGPKGPPEKVQFGALKLAQVTQVPIVPLVIKYHRNWQLKTWDKFQIPYPFSKVSFTIKEPIYLAKNLTEEELQQQAITIAQQLD